MNLTEWILASAVVLLWLRLEVLFHKHDVLRNNLEDTASLLGAEQMARRAADGALHARLNAQGRPTQLEWEAWRDAFQSRLDKLDPPRRRATDKKDWAECGWKVRMPFEYADGAAAKPKKKAAKR